MPYRLDMRDKAKVQLKQVLPLRIRREILDVILDLRDEPKPSNCASQRELQFRYRLKIDGWRVLYKVDEDDQVITILEIRRRNRNTYVNVP